MQKKSIYILLLMSLFSLTFGCQTKSYDFEREDGSVEVLEDGSLRIPVLLYIPEREVAETLERVSNYPYPKLKTFDTPSGYPFAN